MKKLIPPILFLLTLSTASIVSAQAQEHTLVINNLNKKKGKLYIGWYNNADDFRKPNNAVLNKIVSVSGTESIAVPFEILAPGTYAIAVFFDVNNNGKMDTNFLGIPKEKYGFSNNVYPMMRAATFKESAFALTEKITSITIRLK